MKNKILILIFILLFTLAFSACGGEEPVICEKHLDKNEDGFCDACEEKMPKEPEKKPDGLTLIEDGTVNFAFVTPKNVSADALMVIDGIREDLNESVGDVEVFALGTEKDFDVYIYVGIELDAVFDGYSLGHNGYTVRESKGNLVVSAGSDKALAEALDYLNSKLFKKWDKVSTLSFTSDIEKTQETKYRTEISVDGTSLSEYSIVTDTSDRLLKSLAEELCDTFYKKAGAKLPIVNDGEFEGERAIVIRHTDDAGGDGFRVFEKDGNITVECAYKNSFSNAFTKFIEEKITVGEIDFKNLKFSVHVSTVYYEDFKAVGDGVTDDFQAIKAAHDFANECGQTVKAKSGATYYIKNMSTEQITIRTNVDFCGANFIIDDREVSKKFKDGIADKDVFLVAPTTEAVGLTPKNSPLLESLNQKNVAIDKDHFKNFDLGLGYPALIMLYNANEKHYIRYGANLSNSGSSQHELIKVDANGNVDETTPLLFDYKKITSVTVYRIDDKPIEIKNGNFETWATEVYDDSGAYISRGMRIARANVTLSNINHTVSGEIPVGKYVDGVSFCANGYYGFYRVESANNVEIRNCLATSRENYNSSYDIVIQNSNDIRLINVYQTEENYLDYGDWWIMGSNFCKNLYYDNCYLTRFDAHCGVYNATIKNSTIASLRLTGGGEFLIENSTIKSKGYGGDTFIMLREDYGSTWRGDIIIKNCRLENVEENKKMETVSIIWGKWVNHNFGYSTYLPNIYVDNLSFQESFGVKTVNIFNVQNNDAEFKNVKNFSLESFSGKENKNVYTAPKTVVVKNCGSKINFILDKSDFYKRTEFIK